MVLTASSCRPVPTSISTRLTANPSFVSSVVFSAFGRHFRTTNRNEKPNPSVGNCPAGGFYFHSTTKITLCSRSRDRKTVRRAWNRDLSWKKLASRRDRRRRERKSSRLLSCQAGRKPMHWVVDVSTSQIFSTICSKNDARRELDGELFACLAPRYGLNARTKCV